MNRQVIRFLSLLVLACITSRSFSADVQLISTPASENAALSRLTKDIEGQLHLSWVETADGVSSLHHSTLDEGKWSDARLISSGSDWFVNWADFPFLSVNRNTMTAHWLAKSAEGTYDYDVTATFFDHETKKWSDAIVIHKDGVSAEHGFVSMLPMANEQTFITWLDGRNTVKVAGDHAEGHHASRGGMTLRAGIFDHGGKTLKEWELDPLACDCCQTSSAMAATGPVVVYRDRSEREVRDIYITRLVNDQWTSPVPVSTDNWVIAGCPVNGPAVTAGDSDVAVAWFSAKDDQPEVKLAISRDSGATFGNAVVLARRNTNGRVSIAMLDDGDIAVSWLETDGEAARVKLALFSIQGELKSDVTVADTKSSRRSGFPVIEAVNKDVYVTWTDISRTGSVNVARVRF